nr:hypothetical protein [Tanacetum cinerariifolium]
MKSFNPNKRFSVLGLCKGNGSLDQFICNDSYESESSDDEEDVEDDWSQSGDKVTKDNDVDRVSKSSLAQTTTNDAGTLTTLIQGPVTTKEKDPKKNDVKARSMLLMAFLNEHLMTFNRTNEVNTGYGVNTADSQANLASTQVNTASTQVSTANLCDATVYAFLANQPNGAMVAIDGAGFVWSFIADDEVPANMALMAFSDSKNDVMFYEKITVLKRDISYKDSEIRSQIPDNSRKGVGFVSYNIVPPPPTGLFSPPKLDFSNSGLEEFQQPEFESYGPKTSKSVGENISNKVKESPDAPLVKELVSDDKLDKKTIFPTDAKKEFVRPKQQEKPVRKPVNFDMKNIVPKESLTCLVSNATLDESMLWHTRLGHIKFKTINKLVKENLVRGLPPKRFENDQTCVAFLKGKQHKASSTKKETTCILNKFITEIENLVDKKVKVNRCDNRTEFKNSVMNDVCSMKVNTACYVHNRVLVVKPHIKTPYELFRGRTHALSMRPFECHVTILNTLDHLGKFNGKFDNGFFIGYSLNSNAFRVYNIRTRKVEENLHVRFLEDKPIIAGTNSNDFVGTEESIGAGQASKEIGSSKDCILLSL